MDGIRKLLEIVRAKSLLKGHFRGLLHVAIGRKITSEDGSINSTGSTWRELAALLKLLKFDKDLVKELGIDPESIQDKDKFWYTAIMMAKVDSVEARAQADALAALLLPHGITIGPAPGPAPKIMSQPTGVSPPKPNPSDEGKPKGRKKPSGG